MNEQLLECEDMIYHLIKPFSHHYDKEDLYQAGILGLQMAYHKYDESMNAKFSTHAYWWIRGEILKYVNMDKTIPVSKEVLKMSKLIEHTRDRLRQTLLREPTTLEISLILEKEEEDILDVIEQASRAQPISLDETLDSSADLYQSIGAKEKRMEDEIIDLQMGIEHLDKSEQELIYSRYYHDLSQKETSEKLGISQATLSRKEGKILQKLKTKII